MAIRLVLVGASAGGVDALRRFVRDLPPDLDAAVVVVLHVASDAPSTLPRILSRAGPLAARHAEDGDALEPATILVAPPDRHVLVRDGHVEVVRGPRENGHRPAIDPLFRSAAVAWGPRAIAVVLSGALDDGAAGAVSVSRHGGLVVVQDPADAGFGEMPKNAIADDTPEAVLPIDELGAHVAELVRSGVPGGDGEPVADDELEMQCAALKQEATEVDDEAMIRLRRRVGHAYSAETLLGHEDETVERALWTALQALEERADLSRRTARRLRRNDLHPRAQRAEDDAANDEQQAEVVRRLLRSGD